jgi:hypothetical protein
VETSDLERQKTLDTALMNALIEATPETWKAFRLELTFERAEATREAIRHEISNLEGRTEVVSATDAMFEASARLSDHFRSLGHLLSGATYEARQLPSGEWSYHAEWSYAAP